MVSTAGMPGMGPNPPESWRRRIARSRWARAAAIPGRSSLVAKENAALARASLKWLVHSKEHTNFTYDLTPLNREHLAWFVSEVTGGDVQDARAAITEITSDGEFYQRLRATTLNSARSGLADPQARLGRRLGWYAIVRLTRPQVVVETGTDKGLGSATLARALQRNGTGRLLTIDTNPQAGSLLAGFHDVAEIWTGDSVAMLQDVRQTIDLFIHDSLHTQAHELAELAAIEDRIDADSIVISDNSHATQALPLWSEKVGRRFLFFAEKPADHWYPGGGIGAAVSR